MKLNSFVTVARALDEAGVRYLVAGGLAVNAHGYLRYTNDIDDVRFVSIATLIDMKTAVGRQQDLIDVEHLKMRMDGNDRD